MSHGTIGQDDDTPPARLPRTIPAAAANTERKRNHIDAETLSLCQLHDAILAMKPAAPELVSEPDRTSYLALLDVAARALTSAVHCLETERLTLALKR